MLACAKLLSRRSGVAVLSRRRSIMATRSGTHAAENKLVLRDRERLLEEERIFVVSAKGLYHALDLWKQRRIAACDGGQPMPERVAAGGVDGLNAGARRFGAEEAMGLAALHAAPEFLFGGQKQVLVELVGGYLVLPKINIWMYAWHFTTQRRENDQRRENER